MLNAIARGALLPIAWAFPLAAVAAALYRFPIPLAGYQAGWNAVALTLMATVIYGALGGFPLLALEPVIDLNRSAALRCCDEHDKEVVSQRRDGCGMGVFVALFDVDA